MSYGHFSVAIWESLLQAHSISPQENNTNYLRVSSGGDGFSHVDYNLLYGTEKVKLNTPTLSEFYSIMYGLFCLERFA
jgi:hypothetical protein